MTHNDQKKKKKRYGRAVVFYVVLLNGVQDGHLGDELPCGYAILFVMGNLQPYVRIWEL